MYGRRDAGLGGKLAIELEPAAESFGERCLFDLAARIPFGVMLGVAMLATWYATYYLARNPKAQPVAFAFGGEASPTDYARALADDEPK